MVSFSVFRFIVIHQLETLVINKVIILTFKCIVYAYLIKNPL